METYKNLHSKEQRINESNRITKKYPDRIPIIVCKSNNCTLSDIDKQNTNELNSLIKCINIKALKH